MAKKRLNKNIVAILALCAFVTMILLSVLMLRQMQQRDPEHFVSLAQQYEDREDWEAAARFYWKAWERTSDPTYLVHRGEMLLNEGDIPRTVGSWREALVVQPDLIEAHVHLVKLFVEYAQIDGRVEGWLRVQEAAEALLAVEAEKTADQEALARNALGVALIHLLGQDETYAEKGLSELQTAVDLDPEAVDYAIDLAAEYRRQGRVDDEERLYGELIVRHTSPGIQASKARLAYAKHLASPKRRAYQEAESYFKESLTLARKAPLALAEAKLSYAVFLMQQWARAITDDEESPAAEESLDEAETILRQCIESAPDAFDPYMQLAVLYKASRRHAQVVEVCERRLSRTFSRKGIEGELARRSMFRLYILASEACVALSLATDEPQAREEWLEKAEVYVADARGEIPSHPGVSSQAGRLKLARGEDRAALQDLRAADAGYRSTGRVDWENKIILARLHLKLKEPGAAKAVLDEVIGHASTARARDDVFWTLYASVLLENNEPDRALVICDHVLSFDPDNQGAQRLRAAVFERQKMHARAREAYGELPAADVVRAILKARELTLDGKIEQALKVLREALEKNPADIRLVGTTVNELLNLDRAEEAKQIVDEALEANPNDAYLRRLSLLTCQDLTDAERHEAMLAIIDEEPDAYKRKLELINVSIQRQEPSKALPLIDDALRHLATKDTPLAGKATVAHHRALLRAKLRVAASLSDMEALSQARDEAAESNVDGAGGKSLLGLYHDLQNEPELAIKALQEAVELQPTDTSTLAHLGWCLQAAGRTEEAALYLERAIRANPNEALAHKGLAAVAQRRGDRDAYDQALGACQRLIPNDPWVQAELLARAERSDPAGAIARREATLAENPDDFANLLRLAVLCETAGEKIKADRYYGRLRELRPDEADTVILVANYYRRNSEPEQSLELVTHFAATRPTPEEKADAQIIVAAHHVSQAAHEEAEAALLAAADLAETLNVTHSLAEFYLFNADEAAKALPWLDKAANLASAAESPLLPKVLAARIRCLLHRSIHDTETARRYVDDFLRRFPEDPVGLYWDSEVHGRTGHIDKAIESLNAYLQKRPEDLRALYSRAHRFVQLGRPARAIEDFEAIKRLDSLALKLKPRLMLARLHKQEGRKDAWIRELEALAADAPDSPSANEALVQAYIAEGRLVEAERIVTGRINRAGSEPDSRWFFLRGQISLGHDDHDKAVEDFDRGAEVQGYSAESVTRVLNLYLSLERFAEGDKYHQLHASEGTPSSELLSRHARLLALSGQQRQAVEEFRRAMLLAVDESAQATPANQRLPVVAADLQGAFPNEEAITLFEHDAPDGTMGRANDRVLIRLYRAAGRTEDADHRLEQLIGTASSDQEQADLHYERGEMYQLAGKPARARRAYEEALEYDEDNWVTLNNLAYLLSDDLGESRLALPYAKRAAAISDTPAALDTLGWIYVGVGEYGRAIAELSRAIRLDPDMAGAYYHLGEAYRRNGQFLEAGDILTSGEGIARQANDAAVLRLIEESFGKTSRHDSTP